MNSKIRIVHSISLLGALLLIPAFLGGILTHGYFSYQLVEIGKREIAMVVGVKEVYSSTSKGGRVHVSDRVLLDIRQNESFHTPADSFVLGQSVVFLEVPETTNYAIISGRVSYWSVAFQQLGIFMACIWMLITFVFILLIPIKFALSIRMGFEVIHSEVVNKSISGVDKLDSVAKACIKAMVLFVIMALAVTVSYLCFKYVLPNLVGLSLFRQTYSSWFVGVNLILLASPITTALWKVLVRMRENIRIGRWISITGNVVLLFGLCKGVVNLCFGMVTRDEWGIENVNEVVLQVLNLFLGLA